MAILKPNIPLKYVKPDGTTQSEYPLTSIDQVIDEDGIHRLNQTIVRADLSDVAEGQVVLTNADLLDNHPANYFATSEDLNTAIANSTLKMDLLWTNANISHSGISFLPQTLNLNLLPYKFLIITVLYSTDYGNQIVYMCNNIVFISNDFDTAIVAYGKEGVQYGARMLRATSESIDIKDCYIGDSLNNLVCIPYKIYGVK